MLEHARTIITTLADGEACAVATISRACGSVPRPVGTSMLVTQSGAVVGSLSGGCVEAAVYEACLSSIEHQRAELQTFGFSDEDAFAAGLTCGGNLEIFIQPVFPESTHAAQRLDLRGLAALTEHPLGVPVALVRRLDGGSLTGVVVERPQEAATDLAAGSCTGLAPLGLATLREDSAARLAEAFASGSTVRLPLEGFAPNDGGPASQTVPRQIDVLIEFRSAAPRLYLFGANDFSAALARLGKQLGYYVVLCDARPAFLNRLRFPHTDELVQQWPHRFLEQEAAVGNLGPESAVCVLTHDEKFDLPLLGAALSLDLAYVGAMGSRRSHAQRMAGLAATGVTRQVLEKLHSPIGLAIGAVSPEEVAVSVMAEIIACRRNPGLNASRAPVPLNRTLGSVHRAVPEGQPDGMPVWT